MRIQRIALAMVLSGVLAAFAVGSSNKGAVDHKSIIETCKALMHSILTDLKVVVAYVKGRSNDTALVARAANVISAKADTIPAAFEAEVHIDNAGVLKTSATPLIWSNWPEFTASAANLKASADELAKGASKGDWKAIEAGFEAIEQNCGACHKRFRAKKS